MEKAQRKKNRKMKGKGENRLHYNIGKLKKIYNN
jgi:hypothetical protein